MLGPVKEVLMDLALQRLDAGPDDPVFTNSRGGLLHHRNFARRVWEPALRRAGVALRFHELRHTFASFLIYFTRGDVMYVAGQLGHSTPRMTLQTYAHQFTEARKGKSLDRDAVLQRILDSYRMPSVEAYEDLAVPHRSPTKS